MKNMPKWVLKIIATFAIMTLLCFSGIISKCVPQKHEEKTLQTTKNINYQAAIERLNLDICNLQNDLSYYENVRIQCFRNYLNGEYSKAQKDTLLKSYNGEIHRFIKSIKTNYRILNNIEHDQRMTQK